MGDNGRLLLGGVGKNLIKVELRSAGSSGHALSERVGSVCGVAREDKARLAILQHHREFRGGLAMIKRNDDDAFGHDREVNGDPVN